MRSRTFALPLAFLIGVVVIVGAMWVIMRASESQTPLMGLTETEVQARAVALAQNDYQGTPYKISVQADTIGNTHVVECSRLGTWLSTMTEATRGRPNWCAPDTGIWIVTLRGDFRQGDLSTDTVTVVMDSQGTMMQMNSGELAEIGTGD